MYVVEEPCRKVEDWLASYYEYHSEQEQVARFEGRAEDELEHHKAVVILIRALTAEQVPTP
jgi:hypothetical protein